MEGKTIHQKMAEIKKSLSETKIAKSGFNKFAGFKYHELGDFLSEINKLNNEIGVNDSITINKASDLCVITLHNTEAPGDSYSIEIPYSDAEMLAKGGAPSNTDAIQRLGATVTYIRRYLYMTAYNIQENDGVEPNKQDTPPPPKKLTALTKDKVPQAIAFIKGGKTMDDLKAFYSFSKEIENLINAAL